jgi:hypothetical protein
VSVDTKEEPMKRMLLTAGVLAVAAAVLAPTALAQRPDDQPGTIGVGSVTAPVSASARPDDRAEARGPGVFAPAVPATILVAEEGFDWRAAGVGLAGGLGLALLAGGVLVATTHRRREQRLA